MMISTIFSCLLGILAFVSAIAKVRTPVPVFTDIESAVRCFVLYSNCSRIFRIHSTSIMKSKPRRQGKHLSAVFKNSLANYPDFGFIWILMSTLPTIFNAEVLAANTLLSEAFMLLGFPSRSYVSKLMSEVLLQLSNSPFTSFPLDNNSTLKPFVSLVEHILITLV